MQQAPGPSARAGRRAERREPVAVVAARLLRYTAGSVIAAVCSETVFLLLYGGLDASPAVSSALGWLAGAVPNYWLNRSWAWRRRGRPSLTGEVLPYVLIVLVTVGLAAAATSAVHAAVDDAAVSADVRMVLVGGTFLAVYGLVFVLRYALLDRLFRRDQAPAHVVTADREQGGPRGGDR